MLDKVSGSTRVVPFVPALFFCSRAFFCSFCCFNKLVGDGGQRAERMGFIVGMDCMGVHALFSAHPDTLAGGGAFVYSRACALVFGNV